MLTKHVNIFKVEGLPQFTVGGLFRAPGMGAIYRVKVPNHEGSSSG
ncbi:hypothetical protein OKW24_000090 [Peribacillus simplex]|nr:hypothetical protein [Peribacillus simplex]